VTKKIRRALATPAAVIRDKLRSPICCRRREIASPLGMPSTTQARPTARDMGRDLCPALEEIAAPNATVPPPSLGFAFDATIVPSPTPAADETVSELRDARATMERVLCANPSLGLSGFDTGQLDRLFDADQLVAFERARGWFWGRCRTMAHGVNSHWLKHHAGHEIRYLRSGPFIAAANAEGFRVRESARRPMLRFLRTEKRL
jgi:hypothetical protein